MDQRPTLSGIRRIAPSGSSALQLKREQGVMKGLQLSFIVMAAERDMQPMGPMPLMSMETSENWDTFIRSEKNLSAIIAEAQALYGSEPWFPVYLNFVNDSHVRVTVSSAEMFPTPGFAYLAGVQPPKTKIRLDDFLNSVD
jgi:hypothetical protein